MAFNLSTARPVEAEEAPRGFNLATARPVEPAPEQQSTGRSMGRALRREIEAVPDALAGTVELPLQLATGALAQPIGIIAGAGAELLGKDGKATRESVAEALTYQPRSTSARRSAEVLGKVLTPITAAGELVSDVAEGAGATPYQAGVYGDVAMALTGAGLVKGAIGGARTARNVTAATKEANALAAARRAEAAPTSVGGTLRELAVPSDNISGNLVRGAALSFANPGAAIPNLVAAGQAAVRRSYDIGRNLYRARGTPSTPSTVAQAIAQQADDIAPAGRAITTADDAAAIAAGTAQRRAAAGLDQPVRTLPDGRVVRSLAAAPVSRTVVRGDQARANILNTVAGEGPDAPVQAPSSIGQAVAQRVEPTPAAPAAPVAAPDRLALLREIHNDAVDGYYGLSVKQADAMKALPAADQRAYFNTAVGSTGINSGLIDDLEVLSGTRLPREGSRAAFVNSYVAANRKLGRRVTANERAQAGSFFDFTNE